MSEPFIGEIRIFAGTYAPLNWAFCNGQLLSIAQNTTLYSILGATYGGDGRTSFALPNLQGRAPLGFGQGPALSYRTPGEIGGAETATLLSSQMPAHTHTAVAADGVTADATDPSGRVWARGAGTRGQAFYQSAHNVSMHPASVSATGNGQPHNNVPPYLVMNFVIALIGLYPPRS